MTDHERIATEVFVQREAKGWTQHRLAKEAGITRTSVCYLENGRGTTLLTLMKLADALGTTFTIGGGNVH